MKNISKQNANIFDRLQNDKSINLVYLSTIIFAFILSYYYIFDTKLDLNGDNFNYLNYAHSIIIGNGYSSPYNSNYPPTNWYPPGYSTILALAMLIVGENVILLKIINGLFFLGSILLFYQLMSKLTKNTTFAFSISILLVLNSGLLRLSTIIMSEMPYIFFSILAFYCVFKLINISDFIKSKYFFGMLFSAIAAYYLRSMGITLVCAIFVYWLFQKRWKLSGAFLGGFAVFYAPWMIRNSIYGLKGRYLGTVMTINPWRPEEGQVSLVSEFVSKAMINLHDTVIKGFTEVMFPFIQVDYISKSLMIIIGLIILFLIMFGAWKLKHLHYLVMVYILSNIGIFLIWHSGNGARYVWPLVPFITFCFFYAIYNIISLIFKRRDKSIPQRLSYGILLLSLFYITKLSDLNKNAGRNHPRAYKHYFDLAKNIRQSDSNKFVVACRKPGMFYFYSNAFVTNYKYSLDDKEVIQQLIDKDVKYVVLEQLGYGSTPRYLVPAINKNKELFSIIMHLKSPDTYLLGFDSEQAKEKLNL